MPGLVAYMFTYAIKP